MPERPSLDSITDHDEETSITVIGRVEQPGRLERWLFRPVLHSPNIAIGAGAIIGVSARFGLKSLVESQLVLLFPLGTLLVNLIGCFLIGVMQTLFLELLTVRREVQFFVSVGFLGGFTTFSTMSVEVVRLLQAGDAFYALTYQLVSLVGGMAAVLVGAAAAYAAHRRFGRTRRRE